MKNSYNKVSIFFVLALFSFQNLQATSNMPIEKVSSQKPTKSLTSESFDLIQDTLQKIKNGQPISEIFISDFGNTHLKELKQFESTMTPDHDLFDSWITFILKAFSKSSNFETSLKFAKERGESEIATPIAQYNLGLMYQYNEGVNQDFIKAVEYFKKAADQGHDDAQNNLEILYKYGLGVDKDLIKAVEYYEKAVKQGNAEAQYYLGSMYQNGEGVDQDLIKAFEYYEKAADQGNAEAQYNLGSMYQNGQGLDKDLIKAVEYYEKAVKQGNAEAQYYLGSMYQNGEGVDQDFIKAFDLYKKAADQDHMISQIAQNDLGLMYQKGNLGEKDLAQSLKWYLTSAKNKYKIFDDFKINLKSLVTFVPPTIALEDEKDLINNQKILKDNIEYFLGLHGLERGINVSYDSQTATNKSILPFKEGKFAIPFLFKNYSEIVDFETFSLKSILASDQPGFMVTCLQPHDVEAFKSSHCPDIKCHKLLGKAFLTFGRDNIEAADKWMTIFDILSPIYGSSHYILRVLTEIYTSLDTQIVMSDVAQALKGQYISRLENNSKNLDLNMPQSSPSKNTLKTIITKEIEILKELLTVHQQLQNLLIEGTPIRNKVFLQNNDYIEDIFKDQY